MSEGIHVPKREGEAGDPAGETRGLGPQAAAPAKRLFLLEYVDELRRGFKWLRAAPKPETGVVNRVRGGLTKWSKLRKARLGAGIVVLIIIFSSGLFSWQAGTTPLLATPFIAGGPGGPGTSDNKSISDSVGENSEKAYDEILNTSVFKGFTVVLTWTDESTPVTQVNQPDSLGLELVAPNGMNYSAGPAANPAGGQGKVSWSLNDTGKDMGGTNWKIVVVGGNMGDIVRPSGRQCLPGVCPVDRSNAFQLAIDYSW